MQRSDQFQSFENSSYLSAESADYIDALYEAYLENPIQVPDHWRDYFNSLKNGAVEISHAAIRDAFREHATTPQKIISATPVSTPASTTDALTTAYRRFGHLNAAVNPLNPTIQPDPRLQLSHYGLSNSEEKIIATLKKLYCGSISIEYMQLADDTERAWLQTFFETTLPEIKFSISEKKNILEKLTQAEGLEKYLDMRYPGQKRFSIEGADTLIPMLDALIHDACKKNVREIVIGMAHRGRLNVMLNIIGKTPAELFQEFDGKKDYGNTTGDVKYHKGFSSDVKMDSSVMHLSLAFNPSHLEFINTVALGSVRARQDHCDTTSKIDYAFPILIHGDAAFSGQGIVMETLAMSQTRGYSVGGTVHIVINNQVGFTTSDACDLRSSSYCTDIAKMIDAPVLHVNGEDPEAAVRAVRFALAYRMRFHKDIVIDLVCYRVHGHNEADEPRCTQPLMYEIIRAKKTPRAIYATQLENEKIISESDAQSMMEQYRARLDAGTGIVPTIQNGLSAQYAENWAAHFDHDWKTQAKTAVSQSEIELLSKKICTIPAGFNLQRNVAMIYQAREKMAQGLQAMDWGFAETMAYATLLYEGCTVRFTGEDVRRGTFFHRHAAIFDQKTGAEYMPLSHLSEQQGQLHIYDSLLSETGVLGFEYGYSAADPKSLVIWEAQFGDFANVAQVIIDQFISSAWQKWSRLSGLTMLLPHGSEGQGPEHSSARLERYLQLCAQDNIQVCVPTTPAQIFHLLRRQVLRPCRKPLIAFTPKSLLRHKLAVSDLNTLSQGEFQCVIPEIDVLDDKKITRLVLCTGKVYYELLEKRRAENLNHIAIVRIEQLYPFPDDALKKELARYTLLKEIVWCQEEPKNQGAFYNSRHRIVRCMRDDLTLYYAGRESMAAPAAGYPALHNKQQAALINQALGIIPANLSK